MSSTKNSNDNDLNSEPKVELSDSPEIESVIIEKGPCEDSFFVPKKSRDLKEFESLNACGKEISKNIILTTTKKNWQESKNSLENELKANKTLDSFNYWQSFFSSKLGSIGNFF